MIFHVQVEKQIPDFIKFKQEGYKDRNHGYELILFLEETNRSLDISTDQFFTFLLSPIELTDIEV